jgi:hypothetical protein
MCSRSEWVASGVAIAAFMSLWLAVGCGSGGSGGSSQNAPQKPADSSSAPSQAARSRADEPVTLNTLFPPGPGHDLTLSTCGTCHPVACVARGQRTPESWASIKEGHRDKLTNMSGADQDAVFAYLRENFNNTKPEPKIPAELIQQGCTPF